MISIPVADVNIDFSVCVKFIQKFIDGLDSDAKSTPENVEKAFKKVCKTAKKDDNRLVSKMSP